MEILIPLVIGLVQVIKMLGVSKRLIPVVTIFIGVAMAIALNNGVYAYPVIISGIVAGLSAMGLWSGTKAVKG